MRENAVTTEQAQELVEVLGYDFGLMVPNVDQAIDYLRKMYNIVIYNKMAPYVEHVSHRIIYCFSVKWCNLRDGWNGRENIGVTEYTHDIYEAKRQAISIALNYLKNKKYGKTQKV